LEADVVSDSKLKHDMRNRSTILRQELILSFRKNSEHDFAQKHKNKTYFYGSDFVPIYEGCFYYKYKPCIRWI